MLLVTVCCSNTESELTLEMANHIGVTLGGACFASISDEDIASLLDNKDSTNTKSSKHAVHEFMQYMKAKKICCNFESVTPTELNNLLWLFWVEARKQNGEMYVKSSLMTICFGLW